MFLPMYQKIKSFISAGQTDQAKALVNSLSDQDYKLMKKKGL